MSSIKTKIAGEPRKLSAQWTVELESGKPQFGETVIQDIARTYQEYLDWDMTCYMLTSIGWHRIELDAEFHEIRWHGEVKPWLKDNMQGMYRSRGSTWLFEKSQDAALFLLRWS